MVFTGGGTGGHIFPGIAVAEVLSRKNLATVAWIGSSSGRDRGLVEAAGIPFHGVPSGKLRRYFSFKNVSDVFKIAGGFFSSLFLLKKLKPDLLFSKGGFVSVPPCYAAKMLGIPVVTHECDFSPGLATKLNARVASRILLSYEETAAFFPAAVKSRCVVTGNPVREGFFSASAEKGRAFVGCGGSAPVLLVLGGSSGAESLNGLVYSCLSDLCERFVVVHQTGGKTPRLQTETLSAVAALEADGRYFPFDFISKEMPDVLAAADVVVSRAGAGAVWECAAAGKPMVLVPLEKGSSRGDQVENARWFEKKGAALVLSGGDVLPEKLKEAVFSFFPDSGVPERKRPIEDGRADGAGDSEKTEGAGRGDRRRGAPSALFASMAAAAARLGSTGGSSGNTRSSEKVARVLIESAEGK